MAKRIHESDLEAITDLLRNQRLALSAAEIDANLTTNVSRRALQNRLKRLVATGKILREGGGRATRYRLPFPTPTASRNADGGRAIEAPDVIPLSPGGREILSFLRTPPESRPPVGFDRTFLDTYHPGESFLLSAHERAELHHLGKPHLVELTAGTYARHILDRLLIDLSWGSSRLEGNTYTLLDTRRLLAFTHEAKGKKRWEAQMLLNHKEAIEFLVESAEDIGFDRYTVLNLHALLASELLADPSAAGRLRRIAVGIGGSTYLPLAVPQIIEECFDQVLAKASAIEDPFEEALYAMVYLPYLQPFDDVNKRVSRLAANIPFLQKNLSPLSFTDVPQDLYNQAILGVYELRRVDLLRDVFLWAYRRSAARYDAIQQSLGDPNPFRLRHRQNLRHVVGEILRGRLSRGEAVIHIEQWARKHIPEDDQEHFREIVESEILALHEGNFARYRIKPSEFRAWQEVFDRPQEVEPNGR